MEFGNPGFFLLLIPAIPFIFYRFFRKEHAGSISFSSVLMLKDLPVSFRMKMRILLPVLLSLSVMFLTAAMARPREGKEMVDVRTKGIAIMVVFDRSESMMQSMEKDKNRMEVSKEVFRRFVTGDEELDLPGRKNDLIGLITFASFPTVMCPLTLSHESLVARSESLEPISSRTYGRAAGRFSRTAIGDALKLAVAKLSTAEKTMKKENASYSIKSKVIILLTDGANNMGSDPEKAAAFARDHGIRIYSIGIGDNGAQMKNDIFGGLFVSGFNSQGADMKTLESVSEKTEGFAREAKDETSLAEIYREIDKAERTEIETTQFMKYDERYSGFLLAGIILFCLFLVLENTVLGRIP